MSPKTPPHDLYRKPHDIRGDGKVTKCHPQCPAWEGWLAERGVDLLHPRQDPEKR